MVCPKCTSQMKLIQFQGYEVDRCANCKGLWFDKLEYEELKVAENPQILDVGDANVGKQFNKVDNIQCSHCQCDLIKMEPDNQPGICYDGCPECNGVFFDAGEFKDFLRKDIILSFKNLRPRD